MARVPRQNMTIAELNGKDREAFAGAIGWAFEGSPWVAERAWNKRPFATLDALHDAMASAVQRRATSSWRCLRAHPDLGARAKMSDASSREQAGAGLDALTGDELERLRALNAAYREKFGFPFLYAVKGSTTRDILNALERRLTSMRDAEEQEALRQVYRIARFRLEETALGRARWHRASALSGVTLNIPQDRNATTTVRVMSLRIASTATARPRPVAARCSVRTCCCSCTAMPSGRPTRKATTAASSRPTR